MDNTSNYTRDCTRGRLAPGQGRAGSGGHSLGFRGVFLQGQFAGPILPSLTRRLCRAMRVHAQSLQRCRTLCDPIDCSPPGSSVHGILQARILQGVAMPFSRGSRVGSSQPRDQTCIFSPFLHWQMGSSPLAPPGKDCSPSARDAKVEIREEVTYSS